MFGAHFVKCGLSRLLIDLMERGVVTAVATNGAGVIHDFEIAMWGKTSEDVASATRDGRVRHVPGDRRASERGRDPRAV